MFFLPSSPGLFVFTSFSRFIPRPHASTLFRQLSKFHASATLDLSFVVHLCLDYVRLHRCSHWYFVPDGIPNGQNSQPQQHQQTTQYTQSNSQDHLCTAPIFKPPFNRFDQPWRPHTPEMCRMRPWPRTPISSFSNTCCSTPAPTRSRSEPCTPSIAHLELSHYRDRFLLVPPLRMMMCRLQCLARSLGVKQALRLQASRLLS